MCVRAPQAEPETAPRVRALHGQGPRRVFERAHVPQPCVHVRVHMWHGDKAHRVCVSAGKSDRHSRSLCHALVCQPDGANTSARVCARGRRCRRPQEVCSRSRLARAATDRRACVGVRLGGGLSVPALVGTLLSRVSPSARWRRQRHERGRRWGRSQPGRACKRRARLQGQGQLRWSLRVRGRSGRSAEGVWTEAVGAESE